MTSGFDYIWHYSLALFMVQHMFNMHPSVNHEHGAGGGGPVIGGQKASLQGSALQLALEFADDEVKHLEFLRAALGPAALPCPKIDIGYSFNSFVNLTLASLKNYNPYAPFTAYYSYVNLYIAGFILSDPEVFAYNGAATLISNKTYLESAAGILAVEGYHAGAIRENLATVRLSIICNWPLI